MNSTNLQAILDKAVDNKSIFGTSFCVKYKGQSWSGASGNFETGEQFFIASTTKLFITAIIFNFQERGFLSIDNPVKNFIQPEILDGLHVLNGSDWTGKITLRDLLAHTSGLPDYFQQRGMDGKSLADEIKQGNDRSWDFEGAIGYSKFLKPLFVPGSRGKAFYSDTNFQLLGKVIEVISGKTIAENIIDIICLPLGLSQTYLYRDITDTRPKNLYYKSKVVEVPRAMVSFGPDGGMVSTSTELVAFLEGFFNGAFFPVSYLNLMRKWNPIFFPLQAGVGIHRFKLPRVFDLLGKMPELLGHSGLSGALAYHAPAKDLYIAGTVNQVASPGKSFRLAVKLINHATRE